MGMLPGERFAAVVRDGRVEVLVLFFRDFLRALAPERRLVVQAGRFLGFRFALVVLRRLVVQVDAVGDELRILADDAFDAPFGREVVEILAVLQVERDFRSHAFFRHVGDFVGAAAVRAPQVSGFLAGLARENLDLACDHEDGIEPDAELSNQIDVRLVGILQVLHEMLRSRTGDRAEAAFEVFLVHADAVILDGQRPALGIDGQVDSQLGAFGEERRVREGKEAALVERVRGVRNQLAEKDFLVAVEGMDHQVEKILHFGLEFFFFCCHFYLQY